MTLFDAASANRMSAKQYLEVRREEKWNLVQLKSVSGIQKRRNVSGNRTSLRVA